MSFEKYNSKTSENERKEEKALDDEALHSVKIHPLQRIMSITNEMQSGSRRMGHTTDATDARP
jgi:hypothetical protein